MSTQTPTKPTKTRADPARARGLKRSRKLDAALPAPDATPMPAWISPEHHLALMTRARQVSHDATGHPAARFITHIAAFKTSWAELGYYRRLAAAGDLGGTILTAMPQLVLGLAPLHPIWGMEGDRFAVRDRHHKAVRKRLNDLASINVLRWGPGVDEDGEERRTEIYLLEAPAVTDEELRAARAQLKAWRAKYGRALNTHSSTQVRDALQEGEPLKARERQRRGIQHTKQANAARRRRNQPVPPNSKTTPPSGAFRPYGTSQNNTESRKRSEARNVSDRTRVTRTRETVHANDNAAHEGHRDSQKPAIERDAAGASTPTVSAIAAQGSPAPPTGSAQWQADLIAAVNAKQAERREVLTMIASQAQARAVETAGWPLSREWSRQRLAEAWVVFRYGAHTAADSGTALAGPLSDEMYAKLRRAVARYDRNAAARLEGWPEHGLAALFYIGALAADGLMQRDPPRLVEYAIGRLSQIATDMRARRRNRDPLEGERATRRAVRRRHPARPVPGPRGLVFRLDTGMRWPTWALLPGATEPTFDEHGLVLDEELVELYAPDPTSQQYRIVIKDAYRLAGHTLPLTLDGPRIASARADGQLPAGTRPRPRSIEDRALAELAHHTQQSIRDLERLPAAVRAELLEHARNADAAQAIIDTATLKAQLADIHNPSGQEGEES